MIEEIIMKALGWCPGPNAVAEFNQKRGTEKVAGLFIILGIWLVGYWQFTNTALGLYGMERMLYVNRTNLVLLLGGLFIIGYTWKQFKPSDWELPEFNYGSLNIDDLPDIPIDGSYTWIDKSSNPSVGPGLRSSGEGFDKAGELRSTDIEWYRDKVKYYKDMRDERLIGEGKPVPIEPSSKTPIIRLMILLTLIAVSSFGYSYAVLRPQQMVLEAYAFDRLSQFAIIVVKPYDDRYPVNTGIEELYDFNTFISIAQEQGAETIYYKVERRQGNYFVFISPIYNEAYRIYLNEIEK